MASWSVLEEQVVWISPRAVTFTVVCDACVQQLAGSAFLTRLKGALADRMGLTVAADEGDLLLRLRRAPGGARSLSAQERRRSSAYVATSSARAGTRSGWSATAASYAATQTTTTNAA